MTRTNLANALGDTLCACGECDWTGQAHDLGPVFNIEDRIDAGGIVPAGECPICGELAYIVKEEPAPNEAEIMLAAIRARLQGEWDNPALVALGPLHADADADIRRILDGETRGKVKAEPVNADLLAATKRLTQAAACRENTQGDPIRLLEVQAELREAAKQGRAAIARAEAGNSLAPDPMFALRKMTAWAHTFAQECRDVSASGAYAQDAAEARAILSGTMTADRRGYGSEIAAALDVYVTAVAAFATERPDMTVAELSAHLAKRQWQKRATAALQAHQPQEGPPVGLDQEPKAGDPVYCLGMDICGSGEGREFPTIEAAAQAAADFTRDAFNSECTDEFCLHFETLYRT